MAQHPVPLVPSCLTPYVSSEIRRNARGSTPEFVRAQSELLLETFQLPLVVRVDSNQIADGMMLPM